MARRARSVDWGFPRWRDYSATTAATQVRGCDRHGCGQPGDRPAPKAPNRPERWWFCEAHAAEYNKGWDYFAGLTPEEAAARAAETDGAYTQARHWGWTEEGTRPRAERDALSALELDEDADEAAVKSAYRRLAKQHHPDANPDDPAARIRFEAVRAAYDVLTRATTR